MKNTNDPLFIGQKFESFQNFEQFWISFTKSDYEHFTTRDLLKLKLTTSREIKEKLVYRILQYNCKFGIPRPSESKGYRQHSTYRCGCTAYIRLHITKDFKFLEITGLNLEHSNHTRSKDFYFLLPETRRLSPHEKEYVSEILNLESKPKLVQGMISKKYEKQVSLKDLHNIKSSLADEDENNLVMIKEMLEKQYGATVSIGHDNFVFQGLFFTTPQMRADLAEWPEIVFVDGTYKLVNTNMTTMILLVQDEMGRGQIVGVGLIVSEERRVMRWFLSSFKNHNIEVSENIINFMTDKDLTERSVLRELFPKANLYLCLFHTLKTFQRVVNSTTMNLSKSEKVTAKELLEKLTYSSSPKEYEKVYEQFCTACPPKLINYYNKNWHVIKEEWTDYSMSSNNLSNRTNNRLESVNGKIKQVITKNSTLKKMLIRFFDWYRSHQLETTFKVAQQCLKTRRSEFPEYSDEARYISELTKYASDIVLSEIEQSYKTKFTKYNINQDNFQFEEHPFLTVLTTPFSCECKLWNSSCLPCRHIFTVRKLLQLPFYDVNLYSGRWNKTAILSTRSTPEIKTSTPTINKIPRKKVLSVPQKRKIVETKIKNLIDVISLSCGEEYECRLSDLDILLKAYKKGFRVEIQENDGKNLNESMKNLSLNKQNENSIEETGKKQLDDQDPENLNKICMPTPPNIRGHPSGYLRTTPSFTKKKKQIIRNKKC